MQDIHCSPRALMWNNKAETRGPHPQPVLLNSRGASVYHCSLLPGPPWLPRLLPSPGSEPDSPFTSQSRISLSLCHFLATLSENGFGCLKAKDWLGDSFNSPSNESDSRCPLCHPAQCSWSSPVGPNDACASAMSQSEVQGSRGLHSPTLHE